MPENFQLKNNAENRTFYDHHHQFCQLKNRKMRKIFLLISVSLIIVTAALLILHFTVNGKGDNQQMLDFSLGSKEDFYTDFNAFLEDDQMKHAALSFMVFDPESGKVLFEHNGDMALSPASVIKVITTASALEILGNDTFFYTKIGYQGRIDSARKKLIGNVVIKGGGDPCLGANMADKPVFISDWVKVIRTLGIDSITGDIIADDGVFDPDVVPDDWGFVDIPSYYGTAPFGLSVYNNRYTALISTAKKGVFHPGRDSVKPYMPLLTFETHISNNFDQASYLDVHGSYYNWHRIIKGNLPKSEKNVEIEGSIPDPPFLLASQLYEKLLQSGIKIGGNPVTVRILKSENVTCTDEFIPLGSLSSPRLGDIVKTTNMVSQNLYAEHLLIHCGIKQSGRGNTKSGAEAVLSFWNSKEIHLDGMVQTDGSGISRSNAISAAHLSHILTYMLVKSKNKDVFWKSLPVSGESGTLKHLGNETAIQGKIRAKSGSMTRIRGYAGYLENRDGKTYVFAIIINNFTGKPTALREKIEKVFISIHNNL